MAGLPHYKNSKAGKFKYEPIYKNLFEVTILPPAGVSNAELLLEHVNNIEGLDDILPSAEAVTQKYKFTTRSYAGIPEKTSIDVTIEFSLNLNEANELYIYKTLRQWYAIIYEPLTGAMGIKKDYTGEIIIVEFNRAGDIFRKITLFDVFITGNLSGLGASDYSDSSVKTLKATFRCDSWNEELA